VVPALSERRIHPPRPVVHKPENWADKSAFPSAPSFTMQNSIYKKFCFLRAKFVLTALVASASSEAADITYETRALTGTDGPLGPGLGGA
jgi:hypothetical protein